MLRRTVFLFVLLLLSVAAVADPLKVSGSVRARVENWDWFETPGFDDSYTFLGALARVGVAQQSGSIDWNAELSVPMLFGVPDKAIAPAPQGQLGLGASYYGANREENGVAAFVKQAAVRYRWGSNAVRAGRFEFIEGSEMAPKNATLAAVKSSRVANRLVGNFGFTHVQRSFDGAMYTHQAPSWNVTAVAVRPTSGVFRLSGGDSLSDVGLLYGSFTRAGAASDARLFAIGYRDDRDAVKADNRPLDVRRNDGEPISIATLGGHYLALFGATDVLLWGALQTGEWGVLDHSAAAIDVEAGHRWAGARFAPAVRAGYFRSTGDGNAADGDHETFFSILPTPRVYARFPFYNAMNSSDAFVQFSFKPASKLTLTSEIHRLGLTEDSDLWYAGGGAFEKASFGYAGRPSGGSSDFATTIDASLDWAATPKTSVTFYVGAARGGDVVERIFAGDNARFAYVELTRRF